MSDVESARYWLSWLELGSKIAILLVVIGVAYELVEKRFGAPLQKIIDDSREAQIVHLETESRTAQLEIAKAHERIAIANAAAEAARKDAAIANERAAEANEKAEHERLERLRIEKQLSWRVLQPEEREQLIDDLRLTPLGAYRVEVFDLLQHDEVMQVRDQIVDVLRAAGWDARSNANRRAPTSTIVAGVRVEIPVGALSDIRDAAMKICQAFMKVGWIISWPVSSYNFVTDARTEILVGNKV
jgi:hypothetical protein